MNTASKKSEFGLLHEIYACRPARKIDPGKVPAHIGTILDGSWHWARAEGAPDVKGHQRNALKIRKILKWCEAQSVRAVILWMLPIDNLQRDATKLEPLQDMIRKTAQRLQRTGEYRLRVLGDTGLIDPKLAEILAVAHETGLVEAMAVNITVAYGGCQKIIAAAKEYLYEQAAVGRGLARVGYKTTLEDIEARLCTKEQPDLGLVIRISDEQCPSRFLLWQSANSKFYFHETY